MFYFEIRASTSEQDLPSVAPITIYKLLAEGPDGLCISLHVPSFVLVFRRHSMHNLHRDCRWRGGLPIFSAELIGWKYFQIGSSLLPVRALEPLGPLAILTKWLSLINREYLTNWKNKCMESNASFWLLSTKVKIDLDS